MICVFYMSDMLDVFCDEHAPETGVEAVDVRDLRADTPAMFCTVCGRQVWPQPSGR